MLELNAVAAAESPMPLVVTRPWAGAEQCIGWLPFIGRMFGTRDQAPAMVEVLGECLILGSALRLKVLLGMGGSTTRRPRTDTPLVVCLPSGDVSPGVSPPASTRQDCGGPAGLDH
jgi:hypothetical protein